MRFRDRFVRFMYGRYGSDKLGLFLLYFSLVIMIANSFINSIVLFIIEFAVVGITFFRFFSKNIQKRYKENLIFEKFFNKVKGYFRFRRKKWQDRKTHVFIKCPKCKANLRLPRIKGKHTVRCTRCDFRFDFKCR